MSRASIQYSAFIQTEGKSLFSQRPAAFIFSSRRTPKTYEDRLNERKRYGEAIEVIEILGRVAADACFTRGYRR
jgi:hypothetical protein